MSQPPPRAEWAPAAPARAGNAGRTVAVVLLVVYGAFVAAVALWPVPVDSGAGGLLSLIQQELPWATYRRIEFAANVLFFVPLGWLMSVVLDRARYLVLPIGILASVAIETAQDIFLSARVSSMQDILANTTGVCLGMLAAAAVAGISRVAEPRV